MNRSLQEKLDQYFSQYPSTIIPANTTLIHASNHIENIYYIKKGLVRQYYTNPEGNEITIHIFKPYSYFPIMLILSNEENTYTFEAIEECHVYHAPAQEVLAFIKENNDVSFDLAQRLSAGLSKLIHRTDTTFYQDSYHKLVSILIYLANKFGQQENGLITISLQITHEDIGTWIGLPRETVSRQMQKLVNNNLIQYTPDHLIKILDSEKLQKELS